jgi:hypothetical protein
MERTRGQVAMAIIAGVILALSAILCGLVTWASLAFADQATCGPTPPVEYRHDVLLVGLIVYALCAVPAGVLVAFGRTPGLIVAIVLSCCAFAPPALSYLFSLFSSALC